MEGEEVAALDPTCYGLVDHNKLYNVNGIVWLNSIEDHIIGKTEALFPLSEIVHHLHSVYMLQPVPPDTRRGAEGARLCPDARMDPQPLGVRLTHGYIHGGIDDEILAKGK